MENLPAGISPANVDGFLKKEFLYKFSIDTWVEDEILAKHTFQTLVVPITCEEGESILRCHRCFTSGVGFLEDSLDSLCNRIDKAITEVGGKAFVKMSHRSPKDVAIFKTNIKAKEYLCKRLRDIPRSDECAQASAWLRSIAESLMVTNGKEALQLLSMSFRVSTDLNTDVEYPEFFKSKVVVRQFVPFNPELEFRAFVSKGKLTALSQYESGMYFKELASHSGEVKKKIVDFWDSIKNRIQLDDYVIDFCILDDGRVFIVELNPFHAHTSACMFTWKEDREIILHGPFTFRYEIAPPSNPLSVIPPYWGRVIKEMYVQQENNNLKKILVGILVCSFVAVVFKIK
eukprot:Phypoly_transcript_12934.p1 GENE.Phypoly_transcript_12934~~Phypoly_transcript_12934.p1  ORF type:complete len:362 (+),score=26.76 Phypoly_transcript_12934:54-1088(+)